MSITATTNPIESLQEQYGSDVAPQLTCDGIPTFWAPRERVREVLGYLKAQDRSTVRNALRPDRDRRQGAGEPAGLPPAAFTVIYHLFSFERNEYIRMKLLLTTAPCRSTASRAFGRRRIGTTRSMGHVRNIFFRAPHLQRILMPRSWIGHPLRKDHPARATEMGPFHLSEEKEDKEQELLRFRPEEWGMQRSRDGSDFIFLNLGPQHPGTHGVLRIVVQLDGEEIVDAVPEIGFHHRGAEKMGERQSWHTYIPYTDRVDYLGGVMNNLAYLTAVEKLAGITVPPRAQVIRVMLSELFRIISHLVWYGTFAQDLGQLSPVFYTFNDRERAFGIIEAICGARMHPNWFRIGGVAQDLPEGWDGMVRDFIRTFRPVWPNMTARFCAIAFFRHAPKESAASPRKKASSGGLPDPNLRACGFEWDFRKKQPYSGYDQFDFDIPTGSRGDCYDRAVVRVEEMRQSLRIIEQCVNHIRMGPY